MRRLIRAGTALALAMYAAGCAGGGDTATGSTAPSVAGPAQVVGACLSYADLSTLVNTVFGAGAPDASSALGKLNNLQHQLQNGETAAAQAQAYNLVSFILKKYQQGGLPGTAPQLVSLVNGIFCFAGLSIELSDPTNAWLVYPSDAAQILLASSGLAGTSLPANVVSEPTLIEITQLAPPGIAGAGPLNTKLDQYPHFFEFTKSSATNAPFTQDVVVGVCPAVGVPAAVLARLRLGHGAAGGFEITPPADASFLSCPTATASSRLPNWLRTLASWVTPTPLFATARLAGGGVGGTAGEFSPFAPVDPNVTLGGGVGGTAGEFLRGLLLVSEPCSPNEAPIGSPIASDCRPGVKLETPLGTPLVGVPVTFAAGASGGTVAGEVGAGCGAFATSVVTTTVASGKSGVCWTLGLTPGSNTVVATPSVGGDVPPGVTFTPATYSFTATANPPTGLVFTQQPAVGSNVVAGTEIPVTVNIVDHNGVRVQGWGGGVTLTLNQNSFSTSLNTVGATAAQGVATFSGVMINKAAAGYRLTASALLAGTPTAAAGNLFNVVAGAGFGLAIVQGDNQTVASGSAVPIAPTVRVTDAFGNLVSQAVIIWAAGGASNGSVNPAQSQTGVNGTAATSWTLGDGANELTATLPRPGVGDLSVLFRATGTTTLSVLNSCAPGSSGDPINVAGKTYAFWIPNPGANKTIKTIELYFSSAGKANSPTAYQIQLATQTGSFDPAVSVPTTTTTTVFLRGNNSENKAATFVLSTPIVGSSGSTKPPVMIQLRVLTNPDGSTINFNTGPCSPGSSCKPPQSCNATEVSSVLPYPLGTTYRKSVGILVKGT